VGAKLSFRYDREADILHIDKRSPCADQESEELGDEVIGASTPIRVRWKTSRCYFSRRGFCAAIFSNCRYRRTCGLLPPIDDTLGDRVITLAKRGSRL
jgi:hypothetical protein